MYLTQPWFTYAACGHWLKTERLQPFTESKDSRYIYQSELDKTCFQNDMPYGGF